jgi:hypothetical protein
MILQYSAADSFPEAIVEHDLKQTFDPTNKSQIEPHILKLEPVQPLAQGTKPHKDDGDSSTRASSPTPVAPSSATTKRARKNPASKVKEAHAFTLRS